MKKATLLIAIVIFCTIVSSCASETVVFKIAPSSHDFDAVNIGATSTFDFIVTNKKSVDMTLTVVSFSTGEFSETTGAQGKTIIAKGTLTVTVEFTPALPGGAKSDTMHVEWTDINGKTGKKDIKLKGEAVPVAIINIPTSLQYSTVGIGSTYARDIDIENTGSADLVITQFNFNGNSSLFSIALGGTVPVTVVPGATHTIKTYFRPVAVGSFPTVLEITHNAVNVATPAEITISAAGGGGRIEFNQISPWDFGAVRNGGLKTDVVEISNTGSIDLNISSIGLATGTIFQIDKIEDSSGNPATTPFAINPTDHVEITIEFIPTTAGNYNDTLNIAHDGSYSASPASLSITGSGRAPIVQTINYTGAVQNWNVPAGIGNIEAECSGAEGGVGHAIGTQTPGKGGKATGTKTVTPGETLHVYVGGEGVRRNGGIAPGGWNGGGEANDFGNTSYYCGSGGGASDIRQGGTALTDRFIVAGAGGGAGGSVPANGRGGNGGGTSGIDGSSTLSPFLTSFGKGGTQSAGGAGGSYTNTTPGQAGSLGKGGNASRYNNVLAGGGGAGYYGGGGGGYHGGAGGGGSSYIQGLSGASTQAGVRTGNGLVTINY